MTGVQTCALPIYEVINMLQKNGIETRLLFQSMARQGALRKYGCKCDGEYPVTDWLSENGFYLPSSSKLTEQDVQIICDLIHKFKM